jgi:deoxyuridine 5''-triphosphate nucleotidohydrolase (dut)
MTNPTEIDVLITMIDDAVDIPAYAHPGDAGVDLVSTHDIELAPGERCVVGTGIAVAVPPGFAAFVHPRSGHAARLGLSLVNAPGTVDAGYRGEIKVIVINLDPREQIALNRGDRIAQLVFAPIARARFHRVQRLPGSHRGDGGLGSTGVGGST